MHEQLGWSDSNDRLFFVFNEDTIYGRSDHTINWFAIKAAEMSLSAQKKDANITEVSQIAETQDNFSSYFILATIAFAITSCLVFVRRRKEEDSDD